MARRSPDYGPRILLEGSPEEFRRVQRIAKAAVAEQPGLEAGLDGILSRFLAGTTDARERVADATAEARPPRPGTPAASGPVVLGYVLMGLAFVGALLAGTALLPPKQGFDIDRGFAMTFSIVGAWVTVVAAIVGSFLPAWGGARGRRDLWQIPLAGVIVIVIGLVAGVARMESDLADVGEERWANWLLANLLAAAALVLLTISRKRFAGESPRIPAQDIDAEFYVATAPEKSIAVAELGALVTAQREQAALVDAAWKAGIDRANRVTRLSKRAAASAKSTSALRWQLEYVSEPDYVPERA